MQLEELETYKLSMEIAENVWNIVISWDYFAKDTIGKQLVRAIDSVSANLSEGFGRFHFKEKLHFSYYSRGSLYESKTWLQKSKNRNMINDEQFEYFEENLNLISMKLNSYINSTKKQLQK